FRVMNDFRTVYCRCLADDSSLLRNGIGGIGIITCDDFYFNSGIVNLLKDLLNTFFWRVIKHRKPKKVKFKILLFLWEISSFKTAFGYAQYTITLFSKFLYFSTQLFFYTF